MAEQITHDVVKEAQSMGVNSPIDDPATTTNNSAGVGEALSDSTTAEPKPSEAIPTTSTNATSTNADQVGGAPRSDKAGGHVSAAPAPDSGKQQRSDTVPRERNELLVNGDSGEQSPAEDGTQQAIGEASGGSDTDISRPGSVDQAKERGSGHLRSNSVKKPAAFKSVSVTKNFLAKSAVSTPSARPGEKVAPAGQTSASTQQSAKPRLVAKSGSGMGNVPRSSLSKLNGAGTGPDASKVWNKNQPIPPPPPKQFTDEELKQQYGIHLATRLQADEAGKEAKWADIDDDEDDWAPDTVQWMDGTKSTVAAVENQPPPQEEPKPAPTETPLEASKSVPALATNTQRPGSTTGTKTILKPGASLSGSNKAGLVLKGQPEKPTLVAKPSTTAPVKSPWAPLPPVEKVSPIQISPPVQHAPPRYSQREPHGYDTLPPPPGPAKEIAPDDFNRSWRDDRGSRELFNSHSGRYEPVNEMRRGSFRDNNSFRQQPSVLQRPSQDGPAEPSAAFQTSRMSADGPAWGRRRNSSNVSGGSGRRMSFDRRAPDLPPVPTNMQRRESQSINGSEAATPGTPRQTFAKTHLSDSYHAGSDPHVSFTQRSSPNVSHVQPASPYGSVGSSAAPDGAAPGGPVQMESAVEVQNRLMREKLERARLAKQKEREAEEKEEAERKERLRKKLEAMGLANEPKSKPKDPSPTRSSPPKDKTVPAPMQSPPKPPVPTSEGEVAQYGMMKVHQPHPVKKPFHGDVTLAAPKSSRGAELCPKPSPSPVKVQAEVQPKTANSLFESSSTSANNLNHDNNKHNNAQLEQSQAQQSEAEARATPQAHKSTHHHPPTTWSTSLTQQPRAPWSGISSAPSSNVWGPPQIKDRALGNGTFDSGYTRGQPHPTAQQHSSQPQPGPPPALSLTASLKPSPSQPQITSNPPFAQQTMYTQTETMPAPQVNMGPKPVGNLTVTGSIAPRRQELSGWGNFTAQIHRDDRDMAVKARENLERMGGETMRPEFRETYKDQQGKKQEVVHGRVPGNATPEVSQPTVAPNMKTNNATALNESSSSQPVISQGGHLQPTGSTARSSRFFPRPAEATNQSSTTSSKSDSPPPPETESHPAFTGDTEHPVVKMPKPSPRVRLPPAATDPVVPVETPVSMPNRARMSFGARPLALDPEWQARFNGLLGKSPPSSVPAPITRPSNIQPALNARPGSLAVSASSRAPLEVRESVAPATVSLPNSIAKKIFAEDDNRDVTTRVSAEEVLLEEREFGSLPEVKLSKVPHLAANEPPVGFPSVHPDSKFHRTLDVTTKPVLNVRDIDHNAESIDIVIRLNNMREPITKAVPRKRSSRKGAGSKPKRTFTPTSATPSNSQPQRSSRKPSGYQGQGSNNHNNPRPPSGGNGWNSTRSTPPHNNNNWTRRPAPVH
ncbi:uncharacterized protein BDR25DRAFT_126217 [Lindgomyces ingoldianus]|uniref:Uncharacterized protein n=1 Tax=Lindgomyces ingoldianus TaxID=673940 RepID=A0ACB6R577_9PLEO|nr:uncharacterized protein BDR25DRAFT_126217 [Lindgomyces ingoldianus]KAF2473935.1 hypothetical protein BDR25DRAFT_126217 [Lindgomyces ingoldianus]